MENPPQIDNQLAREGASRIEQEAAMAAAVQTASNETVSPESGLVAAEAAGESTTESQAAVDARNRVDQLVGISKVNLGTNAVEKGNLEGILRDAAIAKAKQEGHDTSELEYAGRHKDEAEAYAPKHSAEYSGKHRLEDIDKKRPEKFPAEAWNNLDRDGKEKILSFDAQVQATSAANTAEATVASPSESEAAIAQTAAAIDPATSGEADKQISGRTTYFDTETGKYTTVKPETSAPTKTLKELNVQWQTEADKPTRRGRVAKFISGLLGRKQVVEVAQEVAIEPAGAAEQSPNEPVTTTAAAAETTTAKSVQDTPLYELLTGNEVNGNKLPDDTNINDDDEVIPQKKKDQYNAEDAKLKADATAATAFTTVDQARLNGRLAAEEAGEQKAA